MTGRPVESWDSITPGDVLRGVWWRLPSVILVALLVTVLAITVVIVLPDTYTSDGLMYVRLGRAALTVDPTANTSSGSGVSIQETRSAEVMSVAEMINSREIAERVVRRVGAEAINQPHSWFDRAKQRLATLRETDRQDLPGELSAEEYRRQVQIEEAVKKVREWLSVNTPKVGHTVGVAVNGPDPLLVQSIAQSVMDEYTRYHVEAHRSDGSLEFFEQQVAQSELAAIAAREKLQQARGESGWSSIESAETSLRERIVSLEVALDEAESLRAEGERRAASLQDRLAVTREWIPTEVTKGVANVASDTMRTQLFDEQVAESEQLATLKPTHPRYRLLQEKMQRTADIVTGEDKQRELTRESLNPIWQQLESEYSLAHAGAEGLRSKCESLRESLASAKQELARLNREAVTLASLKWQADIAEEKLLDHAKSLEEARIQFELDRKQMSDVTVIQNASLNLKKVGPPRALLASLGGLFGLALGVFQAVLRTTPESLRRVPYPHGLWLDPAGDSPVRREPPRTSMDQNAAADSENDSPRNHHRGASPVEGMADGQAANEQPVVASTASKSRPR